jgi:hypothetical protein
LRGHPHRRIDDGDLPLRPNLTAYSAAQNRPNAAASGWIGLNGPSKSAFTAPLPTIATLRLHRGMIRQFGRGEQGGLGLKALAHETLYHRE